MTNSSLPSLSTFTDADFKRTIWSALRLVGIAVVIGVPLLWWKLGWQSAALLAGGRAHLRLRAVRVAAPYVRAHGAHG